VKVAEQKKVMSGISKIQKPSNQSYTSLNICERDTISRR